MAGRIARREPITASARERKALQRVKSALPSLPREACLIAAGGKRSRIPTSLYRVLLEAVAHLSRGNAVVLQPVPPNSLWRKAPSCSTCRCPSSSKRSSKPVRCHPMSSGPIDVWR